MKVKGIVLAVVVLLASWGTILAQPNRLSEFMSLKLKHSQKLLEGLVKEDFTVIASEAQSLSLLSREENWNVMQTEDYLEHSVAFRRAAEEIKKAANEKNLEGAALGYVEMTMKCVRCHKYVRGVRTAETSKGAKP